MLSCSVVRVMTSDSNPSHFKFHRSQFSRSRFIAFLPSISRITIYYPLDLPLEFDPRMRTTLGNSLYKFGDTWRFAHPASLLIIVSSFPFLVYYIVKLPIFNPSFSALNQNHNLSPFSCDDAFPFSLTLYLACPTGFHADTSSCRAVVCTSIHRMICSNDFLPPSAL